MHYIVDLPRIANPDDAKREAAREEIQQILNNSKWWNILIRFYAQRALDKKIVPYKSRDEIVSMG